MTFPRFPWFALMLVIAAHAAVAAPRGYNEQLAEAEQLGSEDSWALAREAYASALMLAPDTEARRWCELRLAYATWRAEDEPDDWDARDRWRARHDVAFTALLKPYDEGRARDEFWVAAMEARIEFREETGGAVAADRLAIATFWLEQPSSPQAANAFLDYLRELGPEAVAVYDEHFPAYVRLWQEGARLAMTPENRAWFVLQAAMMQYPLETSGLSSCAGPAGNLTPPERAATWEDVVRQAQGTRWEALARAREFLWRVTTGWTPGQPDGAPADVRGRLNELIALGAELDHSPADAQRDAVLTALRALESRWTYPTLRLVPLEALRVGAPQTLSWGAAGFEQLRFEVYSYDAAAWAERQLALSPDQNAVQKSLFVPEDAHRRVWAEDVSPPTGDVLAWRTGHVEINPRLARGFYTAVLRGAAGRENRAEWIDFVVSEMRLMHSTPGEADQPIELYFFRATDGTPVANATGDLVVRAAGGPVAERVTTDASGRVVLPRPSAGSGGDYVVAATVDGESVWAKATLIEARRERVIADLFLDRPLYRPGEALRWKLIARERRDGRFAIFPGKVRLTLRVGSNEAPLLDAVEFPLNALGAVHGETVIPVPVHPGWGWAEAQFFDDAGNVLGETRGLYAFQVDRFVTPALVATVEPARGASAFRPGGEAVFRARLNYFSGGPAGGVRGECRFSASSAYVDDSTDEATSEALRAWIESLKSVHVAALTDANGEAEFRLRLPETLPEMSFVRVAVSFVPEGAPAVAADAGAFLTSAGALVDPQGWTTWRPATPGEEVDFGCRVVDGAMMPMAFAGEAALVERRWVETWASGQTGRVVTNDDAAVVRRELGLAADAWLPAPWELVHAGYVDAEVATKRVNTGADGVVRVRFAMPRAGIFLLRLRRGPQRLAVADWSRSGLGLSVVVVSRHGDPMALPPADTAFVSPASLTDGAPLRFAVVGPADAHRGWLVIESEDAPVITPFAFTGRGGLVEIETPPRFAGRGIARAVWDTESIGAVWNQANFAVERVADPSAWSVRAAAEESRPGGKTTLSLQAPVPVEWAVAVSDESVHRLAGKGGMPDPDTFAEYSRVNGSWQGFSAAPRTSRSGLWQDPRPGTFLNVQPTVIASGTSGGNVYGGGRGWFSPATAPDAQYFDEEEVVILSPFSVESSSDDAGYLAAQTLSAEGVFAQARARAVQPPGAAAGEDTTVASVRLRRHFASTAGWVPELASDDHGRAQVEIAYPDNLTQWRVEAFAIGVDGNTFGRATTFTRTSLPLQARLQSPRVLVAGDTAQLSGVFVNRTDATVTASASFALEGPLQVVAASSGAVDRAALPRQGEARGAWTVRALAPGTATITLTAEAGVESDAMILSLPVRADGVIQETAGSGRLAGGDRRCSVRLPLPTKLDRARTTVSLRLTSSHAAAALDALPYLIDYPYGCVEQTMNRFLPAVVVKSTFADLGLDDGKLERRILGRATASLPPGNERGAGLGALDDVIAQSVARLQGAGNSERGFGWWPDARAGDLWMTAYVVWGLSVAEDAGVDVSSDLRWDANYGLSTMIEEAQVVDDRLAWALAAAARSLAEGKGADEDVIAAYERVFAQRDHLSAAGRASLALAAMTFGDDEQRAVLLRNLENGAQRVKASDLGDTVHWGSTGNYWRAMDGAVESTALTLLALLELDAKHPLIEPAVNWLVLNRRSAHWASTRDTAFAILALTKYIATRGELDADAEVDVFANGKKVRREKFTRESLLAGDTTITIDPKLLRGGNNTIELRRVGGKSPVYAVALASSWARGDAVRPQGHLINVARGFVRQKQEPTLLGTLRITPEPLPADGKSNAAVTGEQVTARVTLNVPNELEYVMVEVPKPAGCEPLNPLSGYDARLRRVGDDASVWRADLSVGRENGPDGAGPSRTGSEPEDEGRPIYREEHDDRSVFFIDSLAAGTWEIVFSLRATTPGDYRALPAEASAMYVPEVRANSGAQRVRIERRAD